MTVAGRGSWQVSKQWRFSKRIAIVSSRSRNYTRASSRRSLHHTIEVAHHVPAFLSYKPAPQTLNHPTKWQSYRYTGEDL
jgi:hypothetical protein